MKPSIVRVLCLAISLPALLSGCDFSADDLAQVYLKIALYGAIFLAVAAWRR